MQLKLHANAATTPRTRAYIQAAGRQAAALARELGISETTVRRWQKRRDGGCQVFCVRMGREALYLV